MHHFKRARLLILMLVIILTTVAANFMRYPTYQYYGRILTMEEFLELVEAEVPLHCTQLPRVEAYLSDRVPIDFACFHTLEERDAHNENVLDKEWERIARENSAPELNGPRDQGQMSYSSTIGHYMPPPSTPTGYGIPIVRVVRGEQRVSGRFGGMAILLRLHSFIMQIALLQHNHFNT